MYDVWHNIWNNDNGDDNDHGDDDDNENDNGNDNDNDNDKVMLFVYMPMALLHVPHVVHAS